jgi:predicted DNA-binding transcriptional regulator AlpA
VIEASTEDLPGLAGRLEELRALVWSRLASPRPAPDCADGPDEALDAEEAARRLGMSPSRLYKNSRRLPFAAKQGRRVVFSARGIERWRAARMRG